MTLVPAAQGVPPRAARRGAAPQSARPGGDATTDEAGGVAGGGPDAASDFGRRPECPIPVAGASAALGYLRQLQGPGGVPLAFHRLGAVACGAEEARIVCVETVTIDGRVWDLLFFSLDHEASSTRPPSGYELAEADASKDPCRGTWASCLDFPSGWLGLASDRMSGLLAPEGIMRPAPHERRICRLMMGVD